MICQYCGVGYETTGHTCTTPPYTVAPVIFPSSYLYTAPPSQVAELDKLLREAVRRLSDRTDWETRDFCRRARALLGARKDEL
ncbi:hypothetical protein Rctr197k_186 [Virus Rctr197k]|nr:hypothetical protein Rctr197k_186 [Virus Rctr197k]